MGFAMVDRRTAAFLGIALLISASASSLRAQVQGPNLGLVWDPEANAVRSLPGISSAALLSTPVDLGHPVIAAAYSPDGDYLLGKGRGGAEAKQRQGQGQPGRRRDPSHS